MYSFCHAEERSILFLKQQTDSVALDSSLTLRMTRQKSKYFIRKSY